MLVSGGNKLYSVCGELASIAGDTPGLFVVVVVSHIQRIGCQPKKLLYTVANPARGLLNREKTTKEKVWQHTPPPHPPHCSFGENE